MLSGGAEGPRALVLQQSDLSLVVGKTARAVINFQDKFLSSSSSPAGLLCQVSEAAADATQEAV